MCFVCGIASNACHGCVAVHGNAQRTGWLGLDFRQGQFFKTPEVADIAGGKRGIQIDAGNGEHKALLHATAPLIASCETNHTLGYRAIHHLNWHGEDDHADQNPQLIANGRVLFHFEAESHYNKDPLQPRIVDD